LRGYEAAAPVAADAISGTVAVVLQPLNVVSIIDFCTMITLATILVCLNQIPIASQQQQQRPPLPICLLFTYT